MASDIFLGYRYKLLSLLLVVDESGGIPTAHLVTSRGLETAVQLFLEALKKTDTDNGVEIPQPKFVMATTRHIQTPRRPSLATVSKSSYAASVW